MQLRAGEHFLQRFLVHREVAAGGMGTVYEVTQLANEKRRALKLLNELYSRDPSVIAMFRQEARIGARIQSPHVVEVIDADIDAKTRVPWILQEWLDGEDLATLVERRGRLSPDEIRAIYAELADALGAAHGSGVVHCDLKPENIMLVRVHQRTMIKVIDFGIARLIVTSKTHASLDRPMGSPFWMAPEQALQGVVRPATDVWALGMIAFYLFTGEIYWLDPSEPSRNEAIPLLQRVARGPMAAASARAAESAVQHTLPDGFDDWFARCTDRNERARFTDGALAARALTALLPKASEAPAQAGDPGLPLDASPSKHEASRIAQALERAERELAPEEIIRRGEQALALDPTLTRVAMKVASASVALAWAQAGRGELAAAIDAASRAIALSGQQGGPWYARGVFRRRAGELEGSLADLDKAIALTPNVSVYHHERGRTLLQLERSEEALGALDQAVRLDGQREAALCTRGAARMKRGEWAFAADDFRSAAALAGDDPRRAQLHHLCAQALLAARRWVEALEAWTEAARRCPREGLYAYQRAGVLRVLGDARSAEQALASAAALGFAPAQVELEARI